MPIPCDHKMQLRLKNQNQIFNTEYNWKCYDKYELGTNNKTYHFFGEKISGFCWAKYCAKNWLLVITVFNSTDVVYIRENVLLIKSGAKTTAPKIALNIVLK